MECVLSVCGVCVKCAWSVRIVWGVCVEFVGSVSGMFAWYEWTVFGVWLWSVYGMCVWILCVVCGVCVKCVWFEVCVRSECGVCVECVWSVCGVYVECLCVVCGVCVVCVEFVESVWRFVDCVWHVYVWSVRGVCLV